jgi:hypothetical protein
VQSLTIQLRMPWPALTRLTFLDSDTAVGGFGVAARARLPALLDLNLYNSDPYFEDSRGRSCRALGV